MWNISISHMRKLLRSVTVDIALKTYVLWQKENRYNVLLSKMRSTIKHKGSKEEMGEIFYKGHWPAFILLINCICNAITRQLPVSKGGEKIWMRSMSSVWLTSWTNTKKMIKNRLNYTSFFLLYFVKIATRNFQIFRRFKYQKVHAHS